MGSTRNSFRPFAASGRRTIGAILLVFTLYTGMSLVLSARTGARSKDQALVLQVAARQRTLTERYAKEVLLADAGYPSAAGTIGLDLKQSADALLHGGTSPAVAGDDDDVRVSAVRGA